MQAAIKGPSTFWHHPLATEGQEQQEAIVSISDCSQRNILNLVAIHQSVSECNTSCFQNLSQAANELEAYLLTLRLVLITKCY